jgi:hypothetical protein
MLDEPLLSVSAVLDKSFLESVKDLVAVHDSGD